MTSPGADLPPRARPERPRRADAQRNYESLLASAKRVFDEQGVDAPLDDVARRAGVGNATMYRHFPTRRELIIAVYADEVTELCARGETLLGEEPPGDALFTWLRTFIAHVATKRELALALADDHGGQRSTLFHRWHAAMHASASALLTRAQRAGAVRADLDTSDLLALANGIALTGADSDQAERLLLLIRHGTDIGR
ncbi:AcrR family transcriptional regulator [Streptosporangium album]|uniref:AcrR family transcriptional regulator n=1 Tax=Streptosporangium album TaxID=47479 RepID=A0A7W7RVI7_9ACTN|nr:TetR/AcrR family transcriptional regulator [Streptosporangium album]MBB4938318.1 AcrR family transcriptional regulator [Streptosporangium album]